MRFTGIATPAELRIVTAAQLPALQPLQVEQRVPGWDLGAVTKKSAVFLVGR
jgi:hypothetical protein